MDKSTRNAIERATQQARKLLDDDFSSQLEGTFDVLRSGAIAAKAGPHLSPRQVFQREKIVAAIEHKRAAGMNAADAVADYLRDTLIRVAACGSAHKNKALSKTWRRRTWRLSPRERAAAYRHSRPDDAVLAGCPHSKSRCTYSRRPPCAGL